MAILNNSNDKIFLDIGFRLIFHWYCSLKIYEQQIVNASLFKAFSNWENVTFHMVILSLFILIFSKVVYYMPISTDPSNSQMNMV